MLVGVVVLGKPGMALVVLSKVEQRLDAVRAVLGGATVTEVAAAVGVSRVSVHACLRRYLTKGVAGLADRSHQPGHADQTERRRPTTRDGRRSSSCQGECSPMARTSAGRP